MNLEGVKAAAAAYREAPAASRPTLDLHLAQAKAWLAEELPALCETDRAAVAWFLSEVLAATRQAPVMRIDKLLRDSSSAYALAAADLMGWLKPEEGSPGG